MQDKLVKRQWYTWVDALDETLDMWHPGRNMYDMPTVNSYIPVRHTLMRKPKLDSDENEMEFMFNRPEDLGRQPKTRVNPVAQINPMGRYALAPGVGQRAWTKQELSRKWSKFRRLSHTKRNFSTMLMRPGVFGNGGSGL